MSTFFPQNTFWCALCFMGPKDIQNKLKTKGIDAFTPLDYSSCINDLPVETIKALVPFPWNGAFFIFKIKFILISFLYHFFPQTILWSVLCI
jgi:hypothetical protein